MCPSFAEPYSSWKSHMWTNTSRHTTPPLCWTPHDTTPLHCVEHLMTHHPSIVLNTSWHTTPPLCWTPHDTPPLHCVEHLMTHHPAIVLNTSWHTTPPLCWTPHDTPPLHCVEHLMTHHPSIVLNTSWHTTPPLLWNIVIPSTVWEESPHDNPLQRPLSWNPTLPRKKVPWKWSLRGFVVRC